MDKGWGEKLPMWQAGPPPRRLAQRVRPVPQEAAIPQQQPPAVSPRQAEVTEQEAAVSSSQQSDTPQEQGVTPPQKASPRLQAERPLEQTADEQQAAELQRTPAPQEEATPPRQTSVYPQQQPGAAQQYRRRPPFQRHRPPTPPRYRPHLFLYNDGGIQYHLMPPMCQPPPHQYRPASSHKQFAHPQRSQEYRHRQPAFRHRMPDFRQSHQPQQAVPPLYTPVQYQHQAAPPPQPSAQQLAHPKPQNTHLQHQAVYPLNQNTYPQSQQTQPQQQPAFPQQPPHTQQPFAYPQQTVHTQQPSAFTKQQGHPQSQNAYHQQQKPYANQPQTAQYLPVHDHQQSTYMQQNQAVRNQQQSVYHQQQLPYPKQQSVFPRQQPASSQQPARDQQLELPQHHATSSRDQQLELPQHHATSSRDQQLELPQHHTTSSCDQQLELSQHHATSSQDQAGQSGPLPHLPYASNSPLFADSAPTASDEDFNMWYPPYGSAKSYQENIDLRERMEKIYSDNKSKPLLKYSNIPCLHNKRDLVIIVFATIIKLIGLSPKTWFVIILLLLEQYFSSEKREMYGDQNDDSSEPSSPSWTLYKYRVEILPEEYRLSVRKAILQEHSNFLGWYLFEGYLLYTVRKLEPLPMVLYSTTPDGKRIKITIKEYFYENDPDPLLDNGGDSPGDRPEDGSGDRPEDGSGDGSPRLPRGSLPVWVAIIPEQGQRNAQTFLELMQKMGDKSIPFPSMVLSSAKSDLDKYISLCKEVVRKMEPEFMLCIMDKFDRESVEKIKMTFTHKRNLPTIVLDVNNMTIQAAMTIAIKAAYLVCETSFSRPPKRILPCMPTLMVVGYDVCHASPRDGRSTGAFVSSVDVDMVQYNYELIEYGFEKDMDIEIAEYIGDAAESFCERNGALPSYIFIYRDNVDTSDLPFILNQEIHEIQCRLAEVYVNRTFRVAYILTNREKEPRFFLNPMITTDFRHTKPSTNNRYEFFVIDDNRFEPKLPNGTALVTFYNVVYDNTGLTPQYIKLMTFYLTKLHFKCRSYGNVPLVLRFAQKLAFLAAKVPVSDIAYEMLNPT